MIISVNFITIDEFVKSRFIMFITKQADNKLSRLNRSVFKSSNDLKMKTAKCERTETRYSESRRNWNRKNWTRATKAERALGV